MTAAIAGVFGALIGSFLNVVVYRVPKGLSIVSPPSACPSCGAGIRGMDNVPLISWLVLRGRCRDCATRISARYPLVELGTALLFAASSAVFLPAVAVAFESGDTGQVAGTIVVTIAFLYFASISVALALIDVDTHRLPNSIVLPSYLVASVLLTTAALAFGDFSTLGRSFTGMAALFVFYLALALLKPGGMGLGDVKLAGVIGLFLGWLGWSTLVVGAFAAFLVGGVYGIFMLVTKRASRGSGIPFGPWMFIGAWIGVFFGEVIADWYFGIIGLTL